MHKLYSIKGSRILRKCKKLELLLDQVQYANLTNVSHYKEEGKTGYLFVPEKTKIVHSFIKLRSYWCWNISLQASFIWCAVRSYWCWNVVAFTFLVLWQLSCCACLLGTITFAPKPQIGNPGDRSIHCQRQLNMLRSSHLVYVTVDGCSQKLEILTEQILRKEQDLWFYCQWTPQVFSKANSSLLPCDYCQGNLNLHRLQPDLCLLPSFQE